MADDIESFSHMLRKGLGDRLDAGADSFVDIVADDVVMEFPYAPPGMVTRLKSKAAIVEHLQNLSGMLAFDRMTAPVVHASTEPDVFILEFTGHGRGVETGEPYDQSVYFGNSPAGRQDRSLPRLLEPARSASRAAGRRGRRRARRRKCGPWLAGPRHWRHGERQAAWWPSNSPRAASSLASLRDDRLARARFGSIGATPAPSKRHWTELRVSTSSPRPTAGPFERDAALLETSRRAWAGAASPACSASSLEMGGPLMGEVHEWLRDHAPRWSVLRPSWFMQNFVTERLPSILHDDSITSATGDGRVPFIDAGDIAAVAVTALTQPENASREHVLTGPEKLSYDEVAAQISEVVGRPIRHQKLSVYELTQLYVGIGLPEDYAPRLAGMDEAIARGSENRVTNEVAQMTGRPPRSFQSFLAAHCGILRGE